MVGGISAPRVIEQCLVHGTSVSAVALSQGFNANVVRKWIWQYEARKLAAGSKLLPVQLVEAAKRSDRGQRRASSTDEAPAPPMNPIEIQIGAARVSVGPQVDVGALGPVLDVLLLSR